MTVFIAFQTQKLSKSMDRVRTIGIYSSKKLAKEAVARVKESGYKRGVDTFEIDEYSLDKDHWLSGFFTVRYPIED